MRQFERDESLFGIGFDMLFSQLYKIMVNKVTLVGFSRLFARISQQGGAKNYKGRPHCLNTILDECSNRVPSMKWGSTDFKWGAGGSPPPLATTLSFRGGSHLQSEL